MSMIVRAATPDWLLNRYSLINVSIEASPTLLLGCSRNAQVLFGRGRDTNVNVLRRSVNAGQTWTDIATFNSTGPNESVQGVIELPNGELLVATSGGSGINARVYKSTGYAANPATATFMFKLTVRGGSFENSWGFTNKCFGKVGDHHGTINVYNGGQTTRGQTDASQIGKARYGWATDDDGENWFLDYDIYAQPQNPAGGGLHMHGSARDTDWNRDWRTMGDSTGDATLISGVGNAYIMYRDDPEVDPNNPVWKYLPIPAILSGVSCQFTSILVTDKHVMFLTDSNVPLMLIYPKTGYRTLGEPRLGWVEGQSFTPVGKALFQAAPGAPILMGHNPSGGYYMRGKPEIRISPNEYDSYTLWRDESAPVGGVRTFAGAIVGPTVGNKLVAEYAGGLLIGTMVAP
jgi:hypothetical protein